MEAQRIIDKHNPRAAYRLRTDHGEVTLVRSTLRPEILHALDEQLRECRVDGCTRFTDADGELRGVR